MASRARGQLEKPSRRRQREFLAAVRRSQALHRGWVRPPRSIVAYRTYLRRFRRPTDAGYFVVLRSTGELAGVINLNEIMRGGYQGTWLDYYAFSPHAGHGYMSDGLAQVLGQAFAVLKLHRVEANIQPGNRRSLALVRRLGFRREGYSPRFVRVGRRWRDHERWAILAEEWRGRRRS